jgi:sugar phosphate isomerase/epimerase
MIMRVGISFVPPHDSPDHWAATLSAMGCRAAVFPCKHHEKDTVIDAYAAAARDHDLLIAEVGAWCNPLHAYAAERAKNLRFCQEQLALAEHVAARCCVNIAGTSGEVWDGGYRENYGPDAFQRVVETTQTIIDAVRPSRSRYCLEPMPWMYPSSPSEYLELLQAVDRPGFAVHLDVVNMINCPQRYFFNRDFLDECFRLLGPHIRSCHVKDLRLERHLTFNLREVAAGDGALDLLHYAQLAHECDQDMPFIIEHLSSPEEYQRVLKKVLAIAEQI